jgi:hypothetical protein
MQKAIGQYWLDQRPSGKPQTSGKKEAAQEVRL